MAFIQELEDLDFDDLLAEFDWPTLPDSGELGFVLFQELAAKLRDRDPGRATGELLRRYGCADSDRAVGIVFGLTMDAEDAAHLPLVRAAVERPEPDVVAEAIDGRRHLGDTDSSSRIEALLDSPHVRVRSAVLRYLAGTKHPDAVAILRASLDDPEGNVRANAVDELVELAGLEAELWVLPLANDPCELVRNIVRDALAAEREYPRD